VETLRHAGHAVTLLVEAAALGPPARRNGHKSTKSLGFETFDPPGLAARLRALRPDAVVVEQWALLPQLGELDGVPVAVDLHGSLLLENVYRRGGVELTFDAGTKLQALRRADLFLVPAAAQIHHFASWLTLAGFDPRALPLRRMPLALPAPAPKGGKRPTGLRLVYAGARWPWIDSREALRAAADVVASLPARTAASLDVFTFDPPRHGLDFDDGLGTWAETDGFLATSPPERVRLHRDVAHAEYVQFLDSSATLALDVWRPNPERMLAATTRSIEFLARGVPVVTVAGAAWAEELLAAGAGFVVPPDDSASLAALLRELAAHPERVAAASSAARRLASETHAMDRAGADLLDWVKEPAQPPRAARSLVDSFLAERQAHLDETLRSQKAAHEAEHAALVEAHRREREEERARHGAEVDALSARHRAGVEAIRGDHTSQLESIVAAQRAESSRRDAEVARQTEQHKKEIAAHDRAHREAQARMTADWERRLSEAVDRLDTERRGLAEQQQQWKGERGRWDALGAEWEGERARWHAREADSEREREEWRSRLREQAEQAEGERGRWQALAGEWEGARGRWNSERARLEESLREQRARGQQEQARSEVERRSLETRLRLSEEARRDPLGLRRAAQGLRRRVTGGAEPAPSEGGSPAAGGASGGDGGDDGRLRPTLRLARLWALHALDRDRG
jgi:hypothetical protein